jgi:hypothetical protein
MSHVHKAKTLRLRLPSKPKVNIDDFFSRHGESLTPSQPETEVHNITKQSLQVFTSLTAQRTS